ncbi:LuxR C-terminal-related transcriptional regulator [Rhodococcus chondri]|uniref:LuxR C-terminal-related transcriptional regulator n=1 Tax=Rhodococcus chondri TaxID=3065941 RepID=A0ABU7JQR7_9NOCA|nr:LuxR C-terminal-related transcriptional regulator [Rhodococcus sp. CC-R104]MEE2032229.1 LuxR C-terminal-related transcriptional regulator [Rhodococcus sp. CC-R104]
MQNREVSDSTDVPRHRRLKFSGDPILAARFAVPTAGRNLVPRPALLERLTAGVQGPLTLINGPAGAGKTVLAAQWVTADDAPGPIAWLTVEPGDTPGLFWAYLIEALHRHGIPLPQVGTPARAEDADQSLLVRLADALANTPDPVVLILDQLDATCAAEITAGLHFVLEHAAGGLRLVLTARSDPLLPLHRYRASGGITEIRNADLVFTRADTRLLLREHGLDLPPSSLTLLIERTEGWAAGLRLSALAMQAGPDPEEFIGEFAADRTAIADYLLAEVLEVLPAETQTLLLRVCITEQIHPELADILTGRRDAAWTLAGLARANAFVERVDGSPWYRLHPLFACVLRAHLRHRHPGLESHLHSQAARWFARSGALATAVTHAAIGGDWQFATDHLVETLALGRLFTGLDTEKLRRVFSAMPENLPGAAPALVRAACRLADHDLADCDSALARADEYLRGCAYLPPRLVRAFLGVLAGRVAGDVDAVRQSAAETDRLLHEIPQRLIEQHPEITVMVLVGLGSAELGAGHLDRAASALDAAIQACGQAGTEQMLCDALGLLALVELLRGRLRRAENHSRRSIALAEESALPPGNPTVPSHLVLAGVATERDDRVNARIHLDLAGYSVGQDLEPTVAVAAAVIGSRLATTDGDWKIALALLHTARASLARRRPAAWTMDELAIAESSVHLAQADVRAALAVLDAAPSDRPEHIVARTRALLAARHDDADALKDLAELRADKNTTATLQVQACLLRARSAVDNGHSEEARRLVRQAFGLARQEGLRRVFVESGPWVRKLLEQDPQLVTGHGWLPAEAPASSHAAPPLAAIPPLTEREDQVLRQAAAMLTTDEIATALSISTNTVKTHLLSIYRKLGVTRRREAVHRARELALL